MSRLRTITIPFAAGQDDSVNAKLLPHGVFANVTNARLPQTGALALRRGWRPLVMDATTLDGQASLTLTAHDLYSYGDSLVALVTGEDDVLRLATYAPANNALTPWVQTAAAVPPVTNVRLRGNMPDLDDDVDMVSTALTSDGSVGCVLMRWAFASPKTMIRIFDTATDQTLVMAELANGDLQRKVLGLDDTFALVTYTGSAITVTEFTASTFMGAPATTLFSITLADAQSWDVAVDSASPSNLHIAYATASATEYRQYTTAGVQVGSTKTIAAATSVGVAIATDDVLAHVVLQVSGTLDLSLLSFEATGSFTTTDGPTAINSSAAAIENRFAVGYAGAGQLINIVAQYSSSGVRTSHTTLTEAHASQTTTVHEATVLFTDFVMAGAYAGFGVRNSGDSSFALTDSAGPWYISDYGLSPGFITAAFSTRPVWACGRSASGAALVPTARKNTTSGVTGLLGSTVGVYSAATVRLVDVGSTSRRPGVAFNNELYVSGGVLLRWNGTDLVESGIRAPSFTLAQSNGSGLLVAGTYAYRAVLVWQDVKTRLDRSIVSPEVQITVTAPNDTVTATVNIPKTLRSVTSQMRIELYRTEVGPGELFYKVATAAAVDEQVDVVDTLPDASIIDEQGLYTDGEFGAVSGVLDIAPPDASSYVAAMRSRLVLGGADATYQVSQLTLPNEPVCFTQPGVSGGPALAYFDTVEGALSVVATLDDSIIPATRDRVYLAGGEGPNLAGVGEFSAPARLPTDVGVYDWRSVLESASGLWFLGTATSLYQQPRGGGTPTAITAAQNRFGATVVGCGIDTADEVAVWALSDDTAVVHDLGGGHWFGDALPFTPVAMTAHQGVLYSVADDGVVWVHGAAYGDGASGASAVVLQVETGDVQAFGLDGWGRFAGVGVLGEYQANATLLLEISYDRGLTYTAIGSAYTVSGLTAGQAFTRQWYPANQRGGEFRLRLTMTPSSTTTEGCRLAGLELYLTARSGPSRLDSARRK